MSQEVVRHCDMPVGKKGNTCGERVPDDEPMLFSFEGQDLEVDLCERHREVMARAFAPFVAIAKSKQTPARKSVRQVLQGKSGKFTTKDVRRWLQEQGREVAPSGRLPNELIQEYVDAHSA